MPAYETLADLIASRKNEEMRGITFILGEKEEVFVSYKELYETSLCFLYDLQQVGFRKGDMVVFQLEDNQQFMVSFWACQLGGMIPVPVTTGKNDEHKLKLFKIWEVLDSPRFIGTGEFMEKLEGFAAANCLEARMAEIGERAFCVETGCRTGKWGEIFKPRTEDISFIQFSSGSTGDPRGVMITHKNVLVNAGAMARCSGGGPEDSSLSWMPLTHDMGLVGTHITSVLLGINQYSIQTQLFVKHPLLWMQKSSQHRTTLLYSPNFGYKHLLKSYREEVPRDWDLSAVRLIVNGAEPISAELCNEFLDRMAPYGLKKTVMYPVYGLAEATLAVTFPVPGEAFRVVTLDRDYLKAGEAVRETGVESGRAVTFMDVGSPVDGCSVRICGEKNQCLEEGRIGHIQICGENVTCGYYNNPEATGQAMTPDGWLDTGDLGLLRDGRLIVTGRVKDIIFIAGQNYYSHDIERVAECVEGVELGKVAAAGVFNERKKCDELVLFVLSRNKLENFVPIAARLKKVMAEKLGIEALEVIPVKNIPRTTSGKVQRYKLREAYQRGEYDAMKRELNSLLAEEFSSRRIDLPENALEEKLTDIWSEVLNIPKVGTKDNFFALGGDSLRAVQMLSRVREAFGVELEQEKLFENPEIVKLARVIGQAVGKGPEEPGPVGNRTAGDGRMPLSSGQQRLFFLDRLNGESPQYNLCTTLKLSGTLDREVLSKSLQAVIERHTVLKASFREENGQPVQVFNKDAELPLLFSDLRSEPEETRERKAVEMAGREAAQPFNLEKAPLVRCRLFCTGEDEHLLVLAAHHIVFDGWSFGNLLKELSFYYRKYLGGEDRELLPLEIQYPDFAGWQAARLEGETVQKQLEYWKDRLAGRLPVLELPADRQRPAVQTFCGARFTTLISGELAEKLRALAGKEETTLFMVLLAAFKLLLFRYTGQEDLLVGTPAAGRSRKELEGLIGFFTNNLVLRTRLCSGDSFSELLKRVRKVTLEAYANQEVPFEKLVEVLQVERDMSRNPLFQVLFGLRNTPLPEVDLPGVQVAVADIHSGTARFDLSLDIRESGEELAADFEYNTDLFNEGTVCRMAGHYRRLLEEVAQDPGRVLEAYELLAPAERHTLLEAWNDTCVDFGEIPCWTGLFEARAAENPQALAVTAAGKSLTYGQLNARANRLAHCLISHGIGPRSVVGIYMDRTADLLAALLAVHKAGGAYLPMDPIFPPERLAYMLEDAGAGIIVTEKALADSLPAHQARILCLDGMEERLLEYSGENPQFIGGQGSLAYLMYTSGSTGKPKGVQVEQQALVNFLLSMMQKTGMNREDILLAVTTLSFDIAGLELFMPLAAGASVVLAGRDEVADGSRLAALLEMHGVTVMQATPATWRLLLESGWKGRQSMRLLCGGEALPEDLADRLLDRCGCLWNVYGPTETTIWSTMAEVERGKAITIGRPIANTRCYVLDSTRNPVPAGIPGELYIGGRGLARGYLNRSELTAEKFIQDPFVPGGRMYRTGDLARFLPDGSLEYRGRLDSQVKIRGFRIELGEIEALLDRNPAVKESVVTVKEIVQGQKSLVAYIIPAPGAAPGELAPDALRKPLKEKLPGYMIPAAFISMESFPMTPNRKIDRKALPMPENRCLQPETGYTPPNGEMEKSIAAIWQEVLKLERMGVKDNFFDLGGHSLLLARVKSRIKETLDRDVSMMDLFKYPTIQTLAAYLAGEKAAGPADPALRAGPGAGEDSIAVIGLSGRYPGARNIGEFWDNLQNGVESIARFSDEEVLAEGIDPAALKKPGYVKAWGVLEDADKFDAAFFGYTPGEAEVLDPQQRAFLEEAWKALEDAGYDTERYQGLVGIFASTGMNSYVQNLTANRASRGLAGDYQVMISNDKDFLATRVAYKLNLEGPGLTVQTACSSSLVAVHLACRSLLAGECDMALAGGVSIRLPQKAGYLYQEGMILSPDGHCRAFDQQAKGTVGGNGAGVVVLKRLKDALADGDAVSAVIKGSAVNNDGSMKIGYTAPRADGQAKAIAEAQARAGIDPDTITYIEAHGTGTPLGDPIEIEALTQVFNRKTDRKGFCAVGSVKTNVGHLDAAAGITGLMKAVLSLRNKMLPPTLHFTDPNPGIDFANSPFFVNAELKEWKNHRGPLRAGVSSFGIGGTNAHVVLEEAPSSEGCAAAERHHLLVFSARTDTALDRLTANFAGFLKKNPGINLADAAYTLQNGRRELERRRFVVCTTAEEAVSALESGNTGLSGPLEELGRKWVSGGKIDWNSLYADEKRKRISLPAYPFEGKSYWVTGEKEKEKPEVKAGKQENLSEWFYVPVWKQSAREIRLHPQLKENTGEAWLVLASPHDFSNKLVQRLKGLCENVTVALEAKTYQRLEDGALLFDPGSRSDYDRLLEEATGKGRRPGRIFNLLGITGEGEVPGEGIDCGEKLFYSMLYLVQAMGGAGWNSPLTLKTLVNGSQRICGESAVYPGKALLSGPCKVIPREYPNVRCASIDFVLPVPGSPEEDGLLELLAAEAQAEAGEDCVAYRGMERWVQGYEKLELDGGDTEAVPLRLGGAYLVTGGLGGMGLTLAEHLAREAQAKLVLLGRSEFPPEEAWEAWLASHGPKDKTSRKIRKLQALRGLGAEILTCRGNVADMEQMKSVREKAEERFGRISGVIHAAGNPGGGMIQMKKREFAENVLAPKVRGTSVLYEVFRDCRPDFFAFCSSLNAVTGGFGQADYSAANAFQDAFARAHHARRGTRVISINWDRWPGVGMAAGAGIRMAAPTEAVHPLLGRNVEDTAEKLVYMGELSPRKDWVLSEHLVMGIPTIAGTTYLEMVRAAVDEEEGRSLPLELREVIFLAPMAVKDGEQRQVFTTLERAGGGYAFQVASRLRGEDAGKPAWQEHVRGRLVLPAGTEEKGAGQLQPLLERFGEKAADPAAGKPGEEFISFGRRWNSLKRLLLGKNEALAEIELEEEFESDLVQYRLHPALLDVATGSVRLAAGGNYLPFSYGRLTVRGPLTRKLYSHIRFKNGYRPAEEIITSDIDILDAQGALLVEIKDFSMRLTSEAAALTIKSRAAGLLQLPALEKLYAGASKSGPDMFNEGITAAEGQEVMGRILRGCLRPQVIVSVKDIHAAIAQAGYIDRSQGSGYMEDGAAPRASHPRPELNNAYVSPKSGAERKLAALWQELLGIDRVGIHDEFFELGGDSLLLIQSHTKLKEMFETELAVVDLYKYNTVALLAKQLEGGGTEEEQPAFEEVNRRAGRQLDIINQKRRQMMQRRGANSIE